MKKTLKTQELHRVECDEGWGSFPKHDVEQLRVEFEKSDKDRTDMKKQTKTNWKDLKWNENFLNEKEAMCLC